VVHAGASRSGYLGLCASLWGSRALSSLTMAGADVGWQAAVLLSLAAAQLCRRLTLLDLSRSRLPPLGLSLLLRACAAADPPLTLHFAGVLRACHPPVHAYALQASQEQQVSLVRAGSGFVCAKPEQIGFRAGVELASARMSPPQRRAVHA
jgi:hypothetical protein